MKGAEREGIGGERKRWVGRGRAEGHGDREEIRRGAAERKGHGVFERKRWLGRGREIWAGALVVKRKIEMEARRGRGIGYQDEKIKGRGKSRQDIGD